MPEEKPGSNTVSPNNFLGFLAEYGFAEREKNTKVSKLRTIRARMEAEGTDLKAFDLMRSLQKLEDGAEPLLRTALRYTVWAGMKIGEQSSLFVETVDMPSDKAKAQLREAEVYNEGHAAGMAGRSGTSSGIAAGTPLHQVWARAWSDGQDELCLLHGLERPATGEVVKPPKKEAKAKPGASAAPTGKRESERGKKDKPAAGRSPKPTPEEMAQIDQIAGNA